MLTGFYPRSGIFLAPIGRPGERYDLLDLNGLPERGDRRQPRARHLVLLASRYGLRRARALGVFRDWPTGRATGVRDGLTRRRRDRPLLLARPTWGGRRGELVLDRPYPNGGITGSHLLFRWQRRGVDYAVSLHEWEPLREAVATLRAIVASAQGRAPPRQS